VQSDLLDLDRAFRRLMGFLPDCAVPLARALAIAEFVVAMPRLSTGAAFYPDELAPWMIAALREIRIRPADPVQYELITRGLEELASFDSLVPEDLPPSWGYRSVPSPHPAEGGTHQVRIWIPLACSIPRFLKAGTAPREVGMMACLTAVPSQRRARADRFWWNNANVHTTRGEQRALRDVAPDAWLSAQAAVEDFGTRGPSRLTRWLMWCLRGPYTEHRLGFELSLPEKDVPLEGASIGLGLAVVIAGVLRGCRSGGPGLRPSAVYAWTGAVVPDGSVAPVDEVSLPAKVRAAHFSGLKGVVVPRGMGDLAREEAGRLDGPFQVIEVSHLAEALEHPHLCETWESPREVVRACREGLHGWRRSTVPMIVAAGAIGLAANMDELREIAGVSKPPPPEAFSTDLVNHGNGIRISGPGFTRPHVLFPGGKVVFREVVADLDSDDRGLPRLVCVIDYNHDAPSPGAISVYNLAHGPPPDVVWSYPFAHAGLPPGLWRDVEGSFFTGKSGCIADLDADGRKEIVVSSAYNPTATSFLWLFDGLNEPLGVTYHPGHIEQLVVRDLKESDWPHVIALGEHNPSGGISLLQIRWVDFLAFHPRDSQAEPRRFFPTQPCAAHIVIPMLPHLQLVEGRSHLGHPRLHMAPSDSMGATVTIGFNATSGRPVSCDYYVKIALPDSVFAPEASGDMIARDRFWWESGRSRIRFTSDSTLTAWHGIITQSDTVQVSRVALPLPDGGDAP